MKKKINLGYTNSYDEVPIKTKKDKKIYYPSFYISDKELPIEPDDVGRVVNAVVKLKITGVNTRTSETKKNFNYDFDVQEITFTNLTGTQSY